LPGVGAGQTREGQVAGKGAGVVLTGGV